MSDPTSKRRPLVGLDLAPIEQAHRAAGTARLVEEQTRVLSRLALPWDWAPLALTPDNPLWEDFAPHRPEAGGSGKTSVRSAFWNGAAWSRRGCDLAFATNGLVPVRGVPVVANFFDANIYEFANTWIRSGRLLGFLILRALARVSLHRSRRLFILSHYGRDYMAARYPQYASKFVVTPGGVTALAPPSPSPPAWAATLDRPFLLNVGVFSDNKNQARVLEAWRQLQAHDPAAPALVLIGSCDAHYEESSIRPALTRLPRPQEVLLPGRVPDAELAWAYAHALAYLQPSFAEGFGLPIVEAMTAGCAVACSRSTSLPETAGEAAEYFDPADPADIARAVRRLVENESLRIELIQRGRERARLYTWEANAAAVAGSIAEVLGLETLTAI